MPHDGNAILRELHIQLHDVVGHRHSVGIGRERRLRHGEVAGTPVRHHLRSHLPLARLHRIEDPSRLTQSKTPVLVADGMDATVALQRLRRRNGRRRPRDLAHQRPQQKRMRHTQDARHLAIKRTHLVLKEIPQTSTDLIERLCALALRHVLFYVALEEDPKVFIRIGTLHIAHSLIATEAHLAQTHIVHRCRPRPTGGQNLRRMPGTAIGTRVDAVEVQTRRRHPLRRHLRHAHAARRQVGGSDGSLQDLRAVPGRLAMPQEVDVDCRRNRKRERQRQKQGGSPHQRIKPYAKIPCI